MQISYYRAYATIPRNEFSKIDQDLRKNPTEATIVVYGYFTGSTDLWWVDFWPDDSKIPFLFRFCVLIHVFRVCESFSLLLGSQHPLGEIFAYFRYNWRFITHDFRKVLCFTCQSLVRELDYCLEKRFLSSTFPLHELLRVLLNRSPAESRLSYFGNLSLIHSWQKWWIIYSKLNWTFWFE